MIFFYLLSVWLHFIIIADICELGFSSFLSSNNQCMVVVAFVVVLVLAAAGASSGGGGGGGGCGLGAVAAALGSLSPSFCYFFIFRNPVA
jgi:hypothetical protein